jgi:hypothetical protein
MAADIISFPTSENRFYRVIDRLEKMAAQYPFLRQDAQLICTDLERFIFNLDQNLGEAYQVIENSRNLEVKAAAWSEAIQEVLPADAAHQVHDAYMRKLACAM